MDDHFTNIYTHRAADYHRMITPEDVEGNLLPALQNVMPFKGKRVLDLGTGTGRLPLLLAGQPAQMACLDLHGDMLRQNQIQQRAQKGRWGLTQGDMRRLPVASGWADVVTAGWAIGHFIGWYAEDWQAHVRQVLQEMVRVAAAGGAIIILETLTTGSLTPVPPTEGLAQYYAWLENEWGFNRQEIRTDFQFAGVEEAVAHTEFFFGPELAAKIREQGWARLPEWTGIWSKRV